ncbi:ChaN family lipoprotein [Bdellovibrio svalbardensis]|uniref:ChaN family lipoprotein n=1 Tax=Bdellovibrio svalbardensis TaxID=2972972 RepID=A0ABT6DIU7_9BACT|nr:ChaN family lipoprotein [Bdellovibrio svalbardensis]MDG0816155.1 ChaN family lipoprotein [Bdellovibrio svalbardensis]
MKSGALFIVWLLLSACAHAQSNGIFRGNDLQPTTLEAAVDSVSPGSIVVIGENHGLQVHQTQQVSIMQALRNKGLTVSVGMEFFTYTQQDLLNQYRSGQLSEADFLKNIQWGSPSYDFYRSQALFPRLEEGAATVALNAPRSLTGKVSKQGLAALTDQEKALLPPQFSLGNDLYKKRFLDYMGAHLPSVEAGERYFAAQSIWDDTMAWQAAEFMKTHPEQVLVIVVGEFHVKYGGGLPDRIHARIPGASVLTFSQVDSSGLTDQELNEEIQPSQIYGSRSHYLWVAPAQGLGL